MPFWRRMFRSVLDLVSPRGCLMCGDRLSISERLLCTSCNMEIERTGEHLKPYDNVSARLFWGKLPIERCAAYLMYHPHSDFAQVIYDLKYRGHYEIGEELGLAMAREYSGSGFFDGIDMIVPMPLHPRRERERGYNQCREIAMALSHATRIPMRDDVVVRCRNTVSQTTLDHADRADNVNNAFALAKPDAVRGRHVLLVDDIVTTGSTLSACGSAVAKADGVRISIATVGRTDITWGFGI